VRGDWLGGGDAAAAAGDDQPQLSFERTGLRKQGVDLAFEGAAVELELDRAGGADEPVEVVDQGKGLSLIETDDLKGTIPAVEAVVLEPDRRLGRRRDRPVDAGQLFEPRSHSGRGYLSALLVVTRVCCGSGTWRELFWSAGT
jgi:hypothetical protein